MIDDKTIRDLKDAKDKALEIIVLMQIALTLEAFFSTFTGIVIFSLSYFIFNFTNSQLLIEFEIFIGIVVSMMLITGLIAIIKYRIMLKRYDT